VLEGELTIHEGGDLHRLQTGDCLEFGEAADTAYANPGPAACRYVVVVGTR
jgi:uncharacterized cupin superfamily protein